MEEKYHLEQSDTQISYIKADQVRIEASAYSCGSVEEMCRPGDKIGSGSGLFVDVLSSQVEIDVKWLKIAPFLRIVSSYVQRQL